ncbi:MAG: glycosyltransferase [Pseudomonadota bacterium]
MEVRRWLGWPKHRGAKRETSAAAADEISADYVLVAESGLFDAERYLSENPDVADASMDPLRHYLQHGGAEGREPGKAFDTAYYLSQLPEGKTEGVAPLLHFLKIGELQGLKPHREWSDAPWWWQLQGPDKAPSEYLSTRRLLPGLAHAAQQPLPAIIIPVFNAVEALGDCLDSVAKHTQIDCRILLIDDASTDPGVQQLLESYRSRWPFECYRNSQNLGFTRTVNKGLQLAGRSDVVLLNADTRVTPGWLGRLRVAAYHQPDVGTVTPFSNNAGAFSVPKPGSNTVPEAFSLERFARAIGQASSRRYPQVPTGNGFCLYIRRDCLDEVGELDAEAFPRGYGEENDFCMRAGGKGWQHVIDDATYIYHVRSASFGEEKRELMAEGRQVIDTRYPTYTEQVREAFGGAALQEARQDVETLEALPKALVQQMLPRVLYVIATRTGGTPQTNKDLMQALAGQVECFVLHCDRRVMTLQHFTQGVYTELARHALAEPLEPFPHHSDEYDRVVADWLVAWSIELVHVRHIAWHSLGLLKVAEWLGIPKVFSFHDYYTICPTVKLLDDQQSFCAGRCTPGEGYCRHELWPEESVVQLKHGQVKPWQRTFAAVLQQCDAFVTTTGQAREVILGRYPLLEQKPFSVIAHGRDFSAMAQLAPCPEAGEPLRLVVPGNISPAKGGALIEALAKLLPPGEIEIHMLGRVSPELALPASVVCHGEYARDEFHLKLAEIKPHAGAVLSIWPETWCHTLTELWSAGVPVVGFDIGAVGERIRETGAGWLTADFTAEALHQLLQGLHHPDQWHPRQQAVVAWQQGEGLQQSCDNMAKEYLTVYERIWTGASISSARSQA